MNYKMTTTGRSSSSSRNLSNIPQPAPMRVVGVRPVGMLQWLEERTGKCDAVHEETLCRLSDGRWLVRHRVYENGVRIGDRDLDDDAFITGWVRRYDDFGAGSRYSIVQAVDEKYRTELQLRLMAEKL